MAGQNHHFVQYAPERIPYATERYVKETNRLYGVLNKRLADRPFIADRYSIADMASYPWIVPHKAQQQNLDDFPHLKRWFETVRARPRREAGLRDRPRDQCTPGCVGGIEGYPVWADCRINPTLRPSLHLESRTLANAPHFDAPAGRARWIRITPLWHHKHDGPATCGLSNHSP
jgi:hypothetical protein